jgi:transcription termination factor Rho
MNNKLKQIVSENKNYKEERSLKYKQQCKDRLSRILKKKVQTTMIGALSTIEEKFGFLWEGDSEDHLKMKSIYEQVRSEILDKGNNQARNIDVEISGYEVELIKHHLEIPVITTKENQDGKS